MSPPLIYLPRVIITETKSLLSLCTWYRFLGWLLKSLPPTTATEVKVVSQILHVIGSKLYSNQPKNLNHVHKYSKYLVSVIITLGGNISGGGTVFYDEEKTSDLGSRAHVLKHLNGIMVFGPLKRKSTKVIFGVNL